MDLHVKERSDYTTNTFPESLTPDGFDVEIISSPVLLKSHMDASLPSEREHVTFHIAANQELKTVRSPMTIANSYTRFTLDTFLDLKLISLLIDFLGNAETATAKDIMAAYTKHDLGKIVSHLKKNAGWKSAFDADQVYNHPPTS